MFHFIPEGVLSLSIFATHKHPRSKSSSLPAQVDHQSLALNNDIGCLFQETYSTLSFLDSVLLVFAAIGNNAEPTMLFSQLYFTVVIYTASPRDFVVFCLSINSARL